MAAYCLSRLQKRRLTWLAADHQRTRGVTASSHQELVRALAGDKGNLSHSLRTLEARGLLVIGRSPGGQAQYRRLTTEGQTWASKFTGSCEQCESRFETRS
jgi:DNA-binding MarR family transcriptional regulator